MAINKNLFIYNLNATYLNFENISENKYIQKKMQQMKITKIKFTKKYKLEKISNTQNKPYINW